MELLSKPPEASAIFPVSSYQAEKASRECNLSKQGDGCEMERSKKGSERDDGRERDENREKRRL